MTVIEDNDGSSDDGSLGSWLLEMLVCSGDRQFQSGDICSADDW